jgi:hypothetical protein
MPSADEMNLFSYYKMRDELFKLEQKLIRIMNFKLNSVSTPSLNELLLLATALDLSDI